MRVEPPRLFALASSTATIIPHPPLPRAMSPLEEGVRKKTANALLTAHFVAANDKCLVLRGGARSQDVALMGSISCILVSRQACHACPDRV